MAGQAVLIGLSELLGNAIDRDGDALTVTNVRVSSGDIGALLIWVYSSNRQSEDGTVVVTMTFPAVKDVIQQTATFNIAGRMPLVGTDGSDVLVSLALATHLLAWKAMTFLPGAKALTLSLAGRK